MKILMLNCFSSFARSASLVPTLPPVWFIYIFWKYCNWLAATAWKSANHLWQPHSYQHCIPCTLEFAIYKGLTHMCIHLSRMLYILADDGNMSCSPFCLSGVETSELVLQAGKWVFAKLFETGSITVSPWLIPPRYQTLMASQGLG